MLTPLYTSSPFYQVRLRKSIIFLLIAAMVFGFFPLPRSADGASAGPNSPASDAARAGAWEDPADAYSSDDQYAESGPNSTQQQDWFGYGFSLPGNAIIDGIEVRLEHRPVSYTHLTLPTTPYV